jgi:hypothetical protein
MRNQIYYSLFYSVKRGYFRSMEEIFQTPKEMVNFDISPEERSELDPT